MQSPTANGYLARINVPGRLCDRRLYCFQRRWTAESRRRGRCRRRRCPRHQLGLLAPVALPHSPSSPSLLRLRLMLLHSHPSSSSASRTRANAVVHADSADDDGDGAAAASRAAARNEGRLPTTLIGLGATSRLPSMISNSSKIAPWVWRSQGFGRTAQKPVSITRRSSLAARRTWPSATVFYQ